MISMLACHLLFSSATRGRNQQYLPTSQGCRAGRTKRYNPHRDHAWQLAGAWYMLAIVISYLLWTWPSFNAYLGQGAPLPWIFFPDKEEGNINSDRPSILLPSFLHFILIFYFYFYFFEFSLYLALIMEYTVGVCASGLEHPEGGNLCSRECL